MTFIPSLFMNLNFFIPAQYLEFRASSKVVTIKLSGGEKSAAQERS